MKIALDISQVIYGTGVSRYTKFLVEHLLLHYPEHQYILFGGSFKRKAELDHWVNSLKNVTNKTNRLSPQMAHFLWNTLHLVKAETFTGKVDLIHTSDWAEPPSRVPKVTTIHDLAMFHDPAFAHPQISQVHRKRLFWVMKESNRIIAPSQATKNDIIKFLNIDPERIDVIPEASTMPTITLNSAEQSLSGLKRLGIHKPFILLPGSGHPRKNVKRAIAAFKKLDLDLLLVIVGHPSADEIAQSDETVIFTDFVNDLDLSLLFSQAQLLLYPSLYEGFGLPILDAFATDTPVVTSKTSSMPEVAGDAAAYVDPEDELSIAKGIINALKNRELLIRRGREQLKEFNWTNTAKMTMKLYENVLKTTEKL